MKRHTPLIRATNLYIHLDFLESRAQSLSNIRLAVLGKYLFRIVSLRPFHFLIVNNLFEKNGSVGRYQRGFATTRFCLWFTFSNSDYCSWHNRLHVRFSHVVTGVRKSTFLHFACSSISSDISLHMAHVARIWYLDFGDEFHSNSGHGGQTLWRIHRAIDFWWRMTK